MLLGDTASTARVHAAETKDDRIALQGWDAERRIGRLFGETLGLDGAAWDVYLLYEPSTVWNDDDPPKPSFGMHQLDTGAGADPEYCLDTRIFTDRLNQALESASI